jgi:4-diphosphocytidyl-2-C-methyl-D-erythritol kinase
MVVFPNCKINLGLHVIRKREDGYHDLETIFFPLPVSDVLEFIPSGKYSFQSSGLPVAGPADQNLVTKAYRLMKDEFPDLPELSIYLHKVIPMRAGLGGGSADGSFTLTALNKYFQLGLSTENLVALSLQLGSDCPFFIINQPCYARGRGEILEPLTLKLSGYHVMLVYPGVDVSTAEAFEGIVPRQSSHFLPEKIKEPIEHWKEWLVNDFEKTVIPRFPVIGEIKEKLYTSGALYVSMTGSGSSCFGIFKSPPALHFPDHYSVFSVQLK